MTNQTGTSLYSRLGGYDGLADSVAKRGPAARVR